jgi:hypothetical protein
LEKEKVINIITSSECPSNIIEVAKKTIEEMEESSETLQILLETARGLKLLQGAERESFIEKISDHTKEITQEKLKLLKALDQAKEATEITQQSIVKADVHKKAAQQAVDIDSSRFLGEWP